jgi:hypothetical protein
MIKVVFVIVTYHLGIVGKDEQLGETLGILLITGNQFGMKKQIMKHMHRNKNLCLVLLKCNKKKKYHLSYLFHQILCLQIGIGF